jgi:hypothetical protein
MSFSPCRKRRRAPGEVTQFKQELDVFTLLNDTNVQYISNKLNAGKDLRSEVLKAPFAPIHTYFYVSHLGYRIDGSMPQQSGTLSREL